jgi:hypothetical protein
MRILEAAVDAILDAPSLGRAFAVLADARRCGPEGRALTGRRITVRLATTLLARALAPREESRSRDAELSTASATATSGGPSTAAASRATMEG